MINLLKLFGYSYLEVESQEGNSMNITLCKWSNSDGHSLNLFLTEIKFKLIPVNISIMIITMWLMLFLLLQLLLIGDELDIFNSCFMIRDQ